MEVMASFLTTLDLLPEPKRTQYETGLPVLQYILIKESAGLPSLIGKQH